jgi:hypothetical protein
MTADFDLIIVRAIDTLMNEFRGMRHEVGIIESHYKDLLRSLDATDQYSALESIRELKAAKTSPVVAAPVAISVDTTLTPAELRVFITQSISKAIDEFKATTPTVRKIRTFSDYAGVI